MNMSVPIAPLQLRHDSAVVLPGTVPRVHPWQKPLPSVLYKYYPPERLHVLTDCMVRFSQREVFDDQRDLRPEVANFGTAEEIRAFMDIDPVLLHYPTALKEAVIGHVLNTPGREEELIRQTQGWLTAPDQFAVFCLCENSGSRRMWNQYARNGTGFVVAFDTQHPTFALLKSPGLIGEIEYSEEPISSFLSTYGASSFFRKRAQYRFEAEWRSVRAFNRFKNVITPEDGPTIYLAPFSPACITQILILRECSLEWKLRTLAAIDARYRHATVTTIDPSQLSLP
jgi:hypothetical protein